MRRILPESIVTSIISDGVFIAAFFVVPKFATILGRPDRALPTPTVWILSVPDIGWLVIAFLVGAYVILKDLYIQQKKAEVINEFMGFFMLLLAGLMVMALFFPLLETNAL